MHLSGVSVEVLMLDGKVDVRLRGKDTRDQAVGRIRKALLKSSGSTGSAGVSGKTPKFGLKSVGKRGGEQVMLKRDSQAKGLTAAAAGEGGAGEEALVLVLQLEDGSQRALEADELPVKLLDKRRRLWFVPPSSVLRAPVLLPPPSSPQPQLPEPVVAEQPKPPPPPEPQTAEAVQCEEAAAPLSSVLRLNAAAGGGEDFGAVQTMLAQHPWLTQVPTLYTFALEARALDAVNAADARDLRRAQLVDAALRRPPVNRKTKPK